jgi:Uma2 family endonuclease
MMSDMESELLVPERWRPLRRREYDRLVEMGVFDHERIELLHGMLVTMSPQGLAHHEVISRLHRMLLMALGSRADVRSQGPFAADDDSEPEPDVMVLPLGDYARRRPDRAFLLIEVANTSVADDRDKAALYASSDVQEYWLVNLPEQTVEVYREAERGTYLQVTRHARGERLHLVAFPDVTIAIADVLPAPPPGV